MSKETVTRLHLVEAMYKRCGYSRAECLDLIDAVLEEVALGLESDGEVRLTSFGTFKVRHKEERMGRNPKTKVAALISARSVVTFSPATGLKKLINQNKDG